MQKSVAFALFLLCHAGSLILPSASHAQDSTQAPRENCPLATPHTDDPLTRITSPNGEEFHPFKIDRNEYRQLADLFLIDYFDPIREASRQFLSMGPRERDILESISRSTICSDNFHLYADVEKDADGTEHLRITMSAGAAFYLDRLAHLISISSDADASVDETLEQFLHSEADFAVAYSERWYDDNTLRTRPAATDSASTEDEMTAQNRRNVLQMVILHEVCHHLNQHQTDETRDWIRILRLTQNQGSLLLAHEREADRCAAKHAQDVGISPVIGLMSAIAFTGLLDPSETHDSFQTRIEALSDLGHRYARSTAEARGISRDQAVAAYQQQVDHFVAFVRQLRQHRRDSDRPTANDHFNRN
ncbi:hypothetical protein HFP57_14915 [Parasphingopyxis algicola]|uniref:hypothetical protein n=1 Tax=Parasphingopyxis algicola TaxID=2026624 RepID=UPI0015A11D54|nr:hypothetical protein [Parasphingopyxis algicola]QLC26190.1 hypothetical protein HFP57_14915 [Parasphingopyxis algicola]